MNKLAILIVLLVAAATVGPADAGTWVDKTARWTDSTYGGLLNYSRILTDGTDLYYFRQQTAKKYDAATDSWTNLTSSPNVGLVAGRDPYTTAQLVDGKFYFAHHNYAYVEIFDPAGNAGAGSWTKIDLPTSSGDWEFNWSQGAVYDPVHGQYWRYWTDATGTVHGYVAAAMDVTTGTWSAPADDVSTGWGPKDSITVNNRNYRVQSVGQTVQIYWVNFTEGTGNPNNLTKHYSSTINLGAGRALTNGDDFSYDYFACYDGTLYLAGGNTSNVFLAYDIAHDSWTELESFTDTSGSYSDHSTAALANGSIVVRDGTQWLVYEVPEPATMSLLCFGGIAVLLRRKRRTN